MRLSFGAVGSVTSLAGGSVTRLVIATLFFGVSVAAVVIGVTGAIFTDTQSVGANTFTAGTIDVLAAPASAVVSFSAMAPGDESVGALTVTNAGSLQMRYAITSVTTENVMAADLDMTIKTGVSTCTSVGFGVDGAIVYGPADLGSTTGINVIGNPATGSQAGDRVLAGAANEVLCIKVALPLAIGNTSQGVTSTASLDLAAEQTANN